MCEITYVITAEEGTPPESPPSPAIRNNATTFGRAVAWQTQWSEEHDGRVVGASVIAVAKKGTQRFVFTAPVPSILVQVNP